MNTGFSGEAVGGPFGHPLEFFGEMLHPTGTATGNARRRVTRGPTCRSVVFEAMPGQLLRSCSSFIATSVSGSPRGLRLPC